jgi:hypothetical protein
MHFATAPRRPEDPSWDRPSTGTVTMFAFDAGPVLSRHTGSLDAPVYMLDGEAEITIARRPIAARFDGMVGMPGPTSPLVYI